MVQVKICGITDLEDARAAIAAGADLLGFNFYRPSPRFIEPDAAREIIRQIRNNQVTAVGVFVNESIEDVLRTTRVSEVDVVQLHGDESPEYCAALKVQLNGKSIIKALRVSADFNPAQASSYQTDAIMLDAFHEKLRGGTGRLIDWSVARAARYLVPRLFLSGGLTPENVGAAIAAVSPYAVDACSSLESSPGKKDELRMREFVRVARNG
jgi:phosphoribosylanthranilate isomerase